MSQIRESISAIFEQKKEIGEINQTKLAKAIGCKPAYVSLFLSGQRRLNDELIEKICRALGVSLADLEGPIKKPAEPQDLREYIEKLKRLYEVAQVPAFRSISRNIDDWLESLKAIATEPAAPTLAETAKPVYRSNEPKRSGPGKSRKRKYKPLPDSNIYIGRSIEDAHPLGEPSAPVPMTKRTRRGKKDHRAMGND